MWKALTGATIVSWEDFAFSKRLTSTPTDELSKWVRYENARILKSLLVPQLGSTEFYARNMYIVYKAAHHLRRCDAALFSTSPDFEPGMASKLQKELNKPVFQIG